MHSVQDLGEASPRSFRSLLIFASGIANPELEKTERMMMNDAARKIAAVAPSEQHYREAPNNIEAEQALLGAILMNNDAYYRVSDFLKPIHLYEPLHRKIFEVAGDIIRMKTKSPSRAAPTVPR